MYKMSQNLQKLAFFNEHVHLETVFFDSVSKYFWNVYSVSKIRSTLMSVYLWCT